MKTGRKAVFFDIDGTLWNNKNEIPESAVEAIRSLRKKGNLAFINSGRSRGYIRNPALLDIGFDGIVSACGTMIEYRGETIFCREIDNELLADTLTLTRKYGFRSILEGKDYIYLEKSEFEGDRYGDKVIKEMGPYLRSINEHWGRWEVCKFSSTTATPYRDQCFEALSEHFHFMIHNEAVAEIVPKGFDKGTGIRKVCELLDVSVEDTVAFGDSANDLPMLQTAGFSVVMGNGQEQVMAQASYITDRLENDGIYKACRYLELI